MISIDDILDQFYAVFRSFRKHYCDKCFIRKVNSFGELIGFIDAVIIDGITALVHAICGITFCQNPISHSSGVRFCSTHDHHHQICHVIDIREEVGNVSLGGCNQPVVKGHMACKDHLVVAVETKHSCFLC